MSIQTLKTINPIADALRPNNFHIRLTVPPKLERLLQQKKIGLSFYERNIAGTLEDAKSEAEKPSPNFLKLFKKKRSSGSRGRIRLCVPSLLLVFPMGLNGIMLFNEILK